MPTGPSPQPDPAPPAAGPFEPTLAELRRRTGTKWANYGPDVLPAWVADMDFAPVPAIAEAIVAAVGRGDLGYPTAAAGSPLPTLFADRARRRWGWSPDPSLIELVGDVMVGVRRALHACTATGDGVVVQTPVYPPFLSVVPDTGRRLVANPLTADDRLDVEHLGHVVRAERPRALLVCSPHNPSGRVFGLDELLAMVDIARRYDLTIVADEIHAELTYEPHVHTPVALLAPERTITLTSASKAFNLAGLRCALVVPGSAALASRLTALPALDLHGMGILAAAATVAAWSPEGDAWQAGLLAHLRARRDQVQRDLGDLLPHRSPEGTYLAWLDARHVDADPYRWFLEHARVALSDGVRFGAPGWVRLNFATGATVLGEITGRLRVSLRG